MRWCHAQLRAGSLGGPEWEGRERSYRVSDFLVNFENAFDVLVERMMIKDPYAIARDMMLMLEWQGGVRTFESAMRLGNRDLVCYSSLRQFCPILTTRDGTAGRWSQIEFIACG
jgi:hypothetical protein